MENLCTALSVWLMNERRDFIFADVVAHPQNRRGVKLPLASVERFYRAFRKFGYTPELRVTVFSPAVNSDDDMYAWEKGEDIPAAESSSERMEDDE